MKIKICILSLLVGISFSTRASLYQLGTLASQPAIGIIPDNSTIGLNSSYTVSGLATSISDLTLTIVLQGGASSDLSGYLRLGNTGSSPSYNLTSLIQATAEAPGGTTYAINFTTTGFQSAFNGQNPNDTWTLFFADMVPGDTSTLNGWSLDITAVPEPVNVAMAVFGTIAVIVGGVRRYRQRTSLASLEAEKIS